MVQHPLYPDDLITAQREWDRTYRALADHPRDPSPLRRRLMRLTNTVLWHPHWGGGGGRGPGWVDLSRQARAPDGHR